MSNKLEPIVHLPGTVNQDVYIKILSQYLELFIKALVAKAGVANLEFKQNNV